MQRMKQSSTLFLKFVILLIAAAGIALCVFMATVIRDAGMFRPILLGMYVTAIPFFLALYEVLKLLSSIDGGYAFSDASVRALKNIKYCAMVIGALYAAGMPYIVYIADQDDAPGAVGIGLIIIFASISVATFAAVLQKLLRDAIDLQSENQLTI